MEGLIEGRIVHYVLRSQDVDEINRRRVPGASLKENWPSGSQAHVGNSESYGRHLPAIVTQVFGHEFGEGKPGVNLQVFLDGNDSYWVTSVQFDDTGKRPGTCHWIERA